MRHDVDALPKNALRLAKIEVKYGIHGTYYFRAKPQSWNEEIIKQISGLNHEIGYHYEDLSTCKGDQKQAIIEFEQNLNKLRKLAPVSTICMHGSPTSKFDSKDLWKEYQYKDFKLIGEPYFDVDFSSVLYLTDTGRRWNGNKVSIRDRVDMKQNLILAEKGYRIRKTKHIIKAANERALPDHIMFTIHPQRWHCRPCFWAYELVFQNLKNVVKRVLLLFEVLNSSFPK